MVRVRLYTRLVVILLVLGLQAFAQIGTATITGTVTDPTGAAVAGVKVVIVETSMNFESRSVTNGDGLYRVQSLQPGTYDVTFESSGFRRLVQHGILLKVGDTLPVNATLQLGQLTEQVQVTGQGELLETETSSTSTVTEGETLYKMPLYQRYVLNTLNLNPGVTMNGYAYGGSLGGFNVAGQRSTGTTVFEDGVFGNDPILSTGTDIKPVENSVEEVKVVTGTLPAEYGHTTGGVVTVGRRAARTKSTEWLPTWPHAQNDAPPVLQSVYRRPAQPGAPDGVPAWFMQPDANVGGPIVIPKVYNGRNKTFFFFGYQKLIEKKIAGVYQPDTFAGHAEWGFHVRRSWTAAL